MDMTDVRVLCAAADAGDLCRLLREMGCAVEWVCDGAEALRACADMRPDIVAADAVLHGMDGFALAKRVRRLDIPKRPGVIVMHMPLMGRICTLPGTAALEKPVGCDMLKAAIDAVSVEKRMPDAKTRAGTEAIMDELGIPEHPGRRYLADAAFLACEDQTLLMQLTKGLYPMTARRMGTDAAAVERAVRRAIEKAWTTGSMESQYRIFKNTIDAARGKPTCGEMIARLSEMLRREV